jgi:hypothetical protein
MFAHVPRNGTGIGIEPAPGGKTNDNTDRLTFKGCAREAPPKRPNDTKAAIKQQTLRFISTLLCHRMKKLLRSGTFGLLGFRLRTLADLLPLWQLLVFDHNPLVHFRIYFRPIGLAHRSPLLF